MGITDIRVIIVIKDITDIMVITDIRDYAESVRDIKNQILQFSNLKCCIKAKEPFKTPF